ncbi:hypothetical protein [Erythrobacter donghaensis]|jgi:hypothetical protein|uniref:hypothetical protein n=1 Tax=Erythrobacter donghaensis TaxID=267135 RepID=UPI00094010CC|nr:hypothetical protein [Erythrobacter donghaensis]
MTTETDTLDRQITMLCTPTLVWRADGSIGATIAFTQTNGVPAAMNGRVGSDGSINLTAMPHDDNYNDNIDITIMLDTSRMVTQDGSQPVAGRWALPDEFSGTGPVTGYGWFCGNDANGNYSASLPITIPDMSFMRVSDTELVIDDDTPDNSPTYAYAMGLVLPGYGNYYMTIDPRITTKTSVGTNFMLNQTPSC